MPMAAHGAGLGGQHRAVKEASRGLFGPKSLFPLLLGFCPDTPRAGVQSGCVPLLPTSQTYEMDVENAVFLRKKIFEAVSLCLAPRCARPALCNAAHERETPGQLRGSALILMGRDSHWEGNVVCALGVWGAREGPRWVLS